MLIFLLLLLSGRVLALFSGLPSVPSPQRIPPGARFLDATRTRAGRSVAFPPGMTVGQALDNLELFPQGPGGGHILPRAGMAVAGRQGWFVRPMTSKERFLWGIPLSLGDSSPEDLGLLPGVGPVLGRRIAAKAGSSVPHRDLSVLGEVKGLGPAKRALLERVLEVP